MTQEDKDRILGQADREYRDAKQELAALKTKMRKLGERLVQVGHVLTNAPENLIFNGQEHDLQFQSLLNPIATVEEFAEVQNLLLPLTNKIRDMVLRASNKTSARSLSSSVLPGFPDPVKQNASANPTPTILALTYRTADAIVDRYLKTPRPLA